MELDSLKDIWKELDEVDLQPGRKEVPILSMLHKRSQGSIARLKRNLNRELIAVLVIYSLTIWYIITYQQLYSELAVLLTLVGGAFVFYYYHKSKLLTKMQCVACEVRSNLKQQLSTLEKYVRFYFIAGTILTPLAYFVAGVIILFNAQGLTLSFDDAPAEAQAVVSQMPITSQISNHRFLILFISMGVVLTAGSYFLNRWMIGKLYGQHIVKLKDLVNQMEEEQ